MNHIPNLKCLLVERLMLLQQAEIQIIGFMNVAKERVNSLHLRRLIDDNLERSNLHAESLYLVLTELGHGVLSGENESITSLIQELRIVTERCPEPEVADAAMIGAIQNIIHYLIAGYGTSCAYANALQMDEVEKLLHNIALEEKQQDLRLTRLAEENINDKAKSPLTF